MLNLKQQINNNIHVLKSLNTKLTANFTNIIQYQYKLSQSLLQPPSEQYIQNYQKYQQIFNTIVQQLHQFSYLIAKHKRDIQLLCEKQEQVLGKKYFDYESNKQSDSQSGCNQSNTDQIFSQQRQQQILSNRISIIEDTVRIDRLSIYVLKTILQSGQQLRTKNKFIQLRALMKYCCTFYVLKV